MKVLMVCLGNICRSPMAHGLLQHKVEQLGLDWQIDSAGTGDWHAGELPDKRAMANMKGHGIDISYQRARQIQNVDLDDYDAVYVMDISNLANVQRIAKNPDQLQKISLIMNEVPNAELAEVPDPYFGVGNEGFEQVYNMLDKATDKIIEKYR